MQMCAAFASIGHDVTLIVPWMGAVEPPPGAEICKRYGVPASFTIEHLQSAYRRWSPHVYAIRAAKRARRLGANLVYSRQVTACAAASTCGVATVFEAHQPLVGRVARFSFACLLRSDALAHVVVISAGLRDYFQHMYRVEVGRVIVAHDGADPAIYSLSDPSAEAPNPTIGYTGHLYPGKGMETIAVLAARMPDVRFEVIGGTPGAVDHWRASTPGLTNLVFHGHLDPCELPQHLARFWVVLAPYRNAVVVSGGHDISAWMSPLKLFEYMAAGKSIVCSDLPVLREVLTDEVDALLAGPDDMDAWERAVRRLIDAPALRRRLGATARVHLEQRYAWPIRARQVLGDFHERA
ncbi:MAG TPA: glycosyltransferase family 4 protein [Kiritimatiellia bacterium]|nr:glycosyltransferase family 4 protein [Kiritimatiellia bacterium]HMP90852.1 glycosyltransferase family 4 protein [Kiritimatiellia bacterium]